jgi:transposase
MDSIFEIEFWRHRGCLGEVAERFDVSQSYISRARSRRNRLGQASPGAQCNHVPLRLAALKEPLLAQVASAPEQTLTQLCLWVKEEHGIEVGPTTMCKTLARLGLTLKKKDSAYQRAETRRRSPGAGGLERRTSGAGGGRAADLSR